MLSSSEKYELKKKFRHLEAEICKTETALDSKADLVDGKVPVEQLPLTQDIIDALNNANAPDGTNYFTTLADLSSIIPGTLINVAANYSALPAANTVPGEFYWVENSQGTSWLPGPLGGTYYPNGLYYSNGTTWIFTDVPFNATQVEVDAGLNNNKFVTPQTFANAAKWGTKQDTVTLTTTGTSGAATLTGATLNIPQYQSQLTFDNTPTNGSTNPITSDGVYDALQLKQDNVTLTTTGTSGAATLVGSTLNIPQYQGVLTNPVTGTGTAGQVAYFNGTSAVTGSANLFWDNTNGRLGIGTASPSGASFVIKGGVNNGFDAIRFASQYSAEGYLGGDNGKSWISSGATGSGSSINFVSTSLTYRSNTHIFTNGSGTEIFRNDSSGNIVIGTNTASARLHVRGSGTTVATTALLVQNSNSTEIFRIYDDGQIYISGKTVPSPDYITLIAIGTGSSNSAKMSFFGKSNIYINSSTTTEDIPSALLAMGGTTKGFLPPRMTTTQRDAIATPAAGLEIYNTTTGTNDTYNGTAWTSEISGTGTAGQVAYFNGTSAVTGSSNLFWDNTNGRLGVGTASPGEKLSIQTTTSSATNNIIQAYSNSGAQSAFRVTDQGTGIFRNYSSIGPIATNGYGAVGSNYYVDGSLTRRTGADSVSAIEFPVGGFEFKRAGNGAAGSAISFTTTMTLNQAGDLGLGISTTTPSARLHVRGSGTTSATTALLVQNSTPSELFRIYDNGNTGIGTTADNGFKLDVNGTARVQGQLTATSDIFHAGDIINTSSTSGFTISGGTSYILGGSLRMFPQSSSTQANQIQIWSSGNHTGTFFSTGNFTIGTGNTDVSARLGIRGSGTTSATTALLVQNSAATELFRIYDNGNTGIGTTADNGFKLDVNGTIRSSGIIYGGTFTPGAGLQATDFFATTGRVRAGGGISFRSPVVGDNGWFGFNGGGNGIQVYVASGVVANFGGYGADTNPILSLSTGFNPSSGTGDKQNLSITTQYNTSGTYSGGLHGILYNPSLISLTGVTFHRAIQTVTGDILLGTTSGSTSIGATTTINASAQLQVVSTTKGFLPPVMTTTQRDAITTPAAGLIVYDNTNSSIDLYTSTWRSLVSTSNYEGMNIAFGTTTGTKIGTATTEKLSFWGAAPDVQPTTAITAAAFSAGTSGIIDDSATFGGYTIGQIVAAMKRAGLLA